MNSVCRCSPRTHSSKAAGSVANGKPVGTLAPGAAGPTTRGREGAAFAVGTDQSVLRILRLTMCQLQIAAAGSAAIRCFRPE